MTSATRKRRRITLSHAALLLSYLYRDDRRKFAYAFAPTWSPALSLPPKPHHSQHLRHSSPRQILHRCATQLEMFGTKRPRADSLKMPTSSQSTHLENDEPSNIKPKKPNFSALPDFMQKDPTLLTDKRILQQKLDALKAKEFSSSSHQNNMEMMAMSAVSIALAISVVYSLASSTPDVATFADATMSVSDVVNFQGTGESGTAVKELLIDRSEVSLEVSRLGIATRNVAMTVLPQSADDVIAVSIGEGIAGAMGAVATWVLGMLLRFRGGGLDQILEMSGMEREKAMMRGELVTEAVADGDYFLTRAAAQPLFEAAGLPIFLASLASILVATVPYEAIKLSSQKQMEQEKEKALLDILLQEEELRQQNMNIVDKMSIGMNDFFSRLNVRAQMEDDEFSDEALQLALMEEQKQRLQEVKDSAPKIDYIELFADITKWLEYDVLINNYRGILTLPDGKTLGAGWESAIFGLLVALSSQLYYDVLYIYSDFGNPEKREKTLNRPLELWVSIYTTKCLSAATLFGTYEALRAPISKLCGQIISGAYAGCVGSDDFDFCMEAYMVENPPKASFMAVFRAFVVSAMNWLDNLTWFLPLNDQESLTSFARGTIVTMYSNLDRILSV